MVSRMVGSFLIGVVVLLSLATDTLPMTSRPVLPVMNSTLPATNSPSTTTNSKSSAINSSSPTTNSTSSAKNSTSSMTNTTLSATNSPSSTTNSPSPTPNSTSFATKSTPPVTNTTPLVNNSTSSVKNSKSPVENSKKPVQKSSKPAALPLAGELYEGGFLQAHPELCPAHGKHLRLLVLVTSAPDHAAQRDAVRLTWGHYAARRDIVIAFVLGAPPPDLRKKLAAEDDLYGDIIIGNSIDAYSNLTLKTMSMLEWTATYCERAPRLLKTDDDVFLNVPLLLSFMAKRANDTRTIWGKVHKWPPNRSPKSKYFVSQREFKGRLFPYFATGPAYLLTSDCITPLLSAARDKTYLKLEDVFVTGIVAEKLHIKRVHASEFYNRKISAQRCTIRRTIAAHMVKYHEQLDFWRMLLDGQSKC